MPKNDVTPEGRSQLLTSSRRGFFQKLASVSLLSLVQPATSTFGRSLPKFRFGDHVSLAWEAEEGVPRLAIGKVIGICWHPIDQQWEYQIFWDGEPFDGYLTGELELNHYA